MRLVVIVGVLLGLASVSRADWGGWVDHRPIRPNVVLVEVLNARNYQIEALQKEVVAIRVARGMPANPQRFDWYEMDLGVHFVDDYWVQDRDFAFWKDQLAWLNQK